MKDRYSIDKRGLMHDFHYEGGRLFCEGVAVEDIVRETGTPLYLYSLNTLRRHFRVFDEAFAAIPHIVCFAMKANSNSAVVGAFAAMGGGADVVSGGELYRALLAGVPAGRIVYAGVGKTIPEIEYALSSGILMFNIESREELEVINAVAGRMGKKARIALRINPDVDAGTHPYISTGLKKNKFGVAYEDAPALYREAARLPGASRGARLSALRGRQEAAHLGAESVHGAGELAFDQIASVDGHCAALLALVV